MQSISGELQGSLDAIAENAALACGADDAVINLVGGDTLSIAAHHGPIETTPGRTISLTSGSYGARAVLDRAVVHVPDVLDRTDPQTEQLRNFAVQGGWRTLLAIPEPAR